MKNTLKMAFVLLFTLVISESATAKPGDGTGGEGTGNNNDSTPSLKSNIVIFKMITAPAAGSGNSNGSLKKAGKVARTSNSHSSKSSALPGEG